MALPSFSLPSVINIICFPISDGITDSAVFKPCSIFVKLLSIVVCNESKYGVLVGRNSIAPV